MGRYLSRPRTVDHFVISNRSLRRISQDPALGHAFSPFSLPVRAESGVQLFGISCGTPCDWRWFFRPLCCLHARRRLPVHLTPPTPAARRRRPAVALAGRRRVTVVVRPAL